LIASWLDCHPETKLIVFDVLASWASSRGMDLNKAQDCRSILDPLNKLGQERGIAVVVLHHNTKSTTSSALNKVSGSQQIAATARIVWILGECPDNPEHRTVAYTKGNLPARSTGFNYKETIVDPAGVKERALEYGIEFHGDFEPETFKKFVAVDGVVGTANEIASGGSGEEPGKSTKGKACLDWLRIHMAQVGEILDGPLKEQAAAAGFKGGTIFRAKAIAAKAGWLRLARINGQGINYFIETATIQRDHQQTTM
jgi:hypothetical protein